MPLPGYLHWLWEKTDAAAAQGTPPARFGSEHPTRRLKVRYAAEYLGLVG
jgi:hypothetical protein